MRKMEQFYEVKTVTRITGQVFLSSCKYNVNIRIPQHIAPSDYCSMDIEVVCYNLHIQIVVCLAVQKVEEHKSQKTMQST